MKKCTTCKQEKSLSEFCKLSKARAHISDGHQSQCKECGNAAKRTPEYRKREKLRSVLYFSKPENRIKKREKDLRYAQTEKGKKAHTKANTKYLKTSKGKITALKISKKYHQTQRYKDAVTKYRLKFPEKRQANIDVMNALHCGKLIRPDLCSVCDKTCIPEGHHPDYSKPLEVIWVCHDCHVAIHWRP